MTRAMTLASLIFLGLFLAATAGIVGYQVLYAQPKARCEAAGMWWAWKWRACAAPLDVSTLTGRANPGAPVARDDASKP